MSENTIGGPVTAEATDAVIMQNFTIVIRISSTGCKCHCSKKPYISNFDENWFVQEKLTFLASDKLPLLIRTDFIVRTADYFFDHLDYLSGLTNSLYFCDEDRFAAIHEICNQFGV